MKKYAVDEVIFINYIYNRKTYLDALHKKKIMPPQSRKCSNIQWINFLIEYKDTESGKTNWEYTVNKVKGKVRRPERMAQDHN